MPITPYVRSGARDSRRGFALLITITLLSFLVLLLVSLSALTRVETQVASNSQQLAQARQNALLALNIALGQLQKYAGPDQRVTGTTDLAGDVTTGARLPAGGTPTNTQSLASPDGLRPAKLNGLVGPQAGTRYWTGVWGNYDAKTDIYKQTPAPVLLNWLVSGNEQTSFSSTNGQITGSNGELGTKAPDFNPSATVSLPASATEVGSIARSGGKQDAVLLVGPATADSTSRKLLDGSSETASDRYIIAPLVNITADPRSVPGLGATSGSPVTIGRYAYWVGDEGVKAKYNLVDSYTNYTSPTDDTNVAFTTREGNTLSTTGGALARYRLMAAQRNGLEGLPGLNYQANNATVGRVLKAEQMRFAGSATVNAPDQQQRVHDVTTTSAGVLTNTLEGGLRKDLTAYLENTGNVFTGGIAPLVGTNIIPNNSPGQGPKWDLLKSYYDLAATTQTGTVDIRPATTTQMGIFPIVSDVRLLFGLKPVNTLSSNATQAEYASSPAQALFNPLIVLTNPYNLPLRLTSGLQMEFKLTAFTDFADSQARGELYFKNIILVPTPYRVLSRVRANGAVIRSPSLLNNVKFQFPANVVIQPGKSAIFSIKSNQVDVGNNATLTEGTPSGSTFYYYGKTVSGSTMSFQNYGLDDGGNSTPLDIVFSNSSGVVLKSLKGLNVDCQDNGSDTTRWPQAFVIGMFKANVSYPGDLAPATAEKNRNRTLRLFADFNLRAANNRQILWLYSLPPYRARWLPVLGTPATEVPTEFTNSLGSGAFWGRDTTTSLQEARLFDLPTPRSTGTEMPLLSLAQLQHADLTADDDNIGVGHQPGYAVGNSLCPPYLPRDQIKQQRPDWHSLQTGSPDYSEVQRNYYDISYLLNCALWDKYFFSAIPQTATSYESVNARYHYVPDATLAAANSTVKATALHNPTLTARYLMVDGAFNINSTSIEGWKAVLGGSRGLKMPGDSQADAAFPRSVRQPGVATVPKPSGDGADTYTGFRRLNDDQLTNLANEIVKQVRLRGPFVSLAQFVNRSLTTSSASLALQGPLQTAIDSATGGINVFTAVTPTQDQVAITSVSESPIGKPVGTYRIFPTTDVSPANTLPLVSEQGYRSTAAPGWLTQADLLQVIGPALSTRSDTFVIRTYGDVKNPLDGSTGPVARAWCEAVVQRFPDYVDTSDNAEVDPANLPATSINRTYGRRFKVVSFRWLSPNDI
ncbi:MAG: hypothetical protein JF599_13985 [Verrucomicrobia bacterium]|nr:hypothetical protein [Verrucomicrobiota bacterium]